VHHHGSAGLDGGCRNHGEDTRNVADKAVALDGALEERPLDAVSSMPSRISRTNRSESDFVPPCAVWPASTAISAPLTNADSSEIR
jgi:hypothetical protein